MEAIMREVLLITALALFATTAQAYNSFKSFQGNFSQQQAREEMRKLIHSNNAIARETRETGRKKEKDALDVYNMEQGYGYDEGYDSDYEVVYDDY
jgi:uncharacterized membrane protein